MLRFFSTMLAVVAGLFVFVLLFFMILASVVAGAHPKKPLPDQVVLELDLRQDIGDTQVSTGVAGLPGKGLTVVGIVEALKQAEADKAVKGLYIRTTSDLGVNPGQAEEIRDAIARFKASGKFVTSHFQDIMDTGIGGYYLASIADEIWMQPSGVILAQGFGVSSPYFKAAMDKLDVSAQVLAYHEYKSAMNPFRYDGPTDAEREENVRLITSIFNSFTDKIAKSRKMNRDQFVALLKGVPYLADEAMKAGWVDKLGYDVDAEDAAKERAGKDAKLVDIMDYGGKKGSPYSKGSVIAFIPAEGDIVEGKAEDNLFGTASGQIAGDTMSEAILDAVKDKDVKAILLRVNSPGGSAIASDQIWNALNRARERKIPVVVEMSGVAASGGYWISMGADRIIAEPSTITGSIGVIGAKFVLAGLYDKLGVSVSEDSVGGDDYFMFSNQHPFTPEEWLGMRKMFDRTYSEFVHKVAEGRDLPVEKVEAIAKGRVWSGADAKDRGLVDELGGLETAIAATKKLAGIKPDAHVELRSFPAHKGFMQQLLSAFGASAEVARTLSVMADFLKLQPTAEFMHLIREMDAAHEEPVRAIAPPVGVH